MARVLRLLQLAKGLRPCCTDLASDWLAVERRPRVSSPRMNFDFQCLFAWGKWDRAPRPALAVALDTTAASAGQREPGSVALSRTRGAQPGHSQGRGGGAGIHEPLGRCHDSPPPGGCHGESAHTRLGTVACPDHSTPTPFLIPTPPPRCSSGNGRGGLGEQQNSARNSARPGCTQKRRNWVFNYLHPRHTRLRPAGPAGCKKRVVRRTHVCRRTDRRTAGMSGRVAVAAWWQQQRHLARLEIEGAARNEFNPSSPRAAAASRATLRLLHRKSAESPSSSLAPPRLACLSPVQARPGPELCATKSDLFSNHVTPGT